MNAYKKLFSRLEPKSGHSILDQHPNLNPRRRHILLIDDDKLFCKVASDALMEAGYKVSAVSNGNTALDLLTTHPDKYNLILLDRMMPELSGLEVLGKLSSQPFYNNIPIIMLTGHAGKSHLEMASQYGVAETVFKPIGSADLINTVNRTLKNKEKEKNLMYN
jgi:CheY-like chemotaxis protein